MTTNFDPQQHSPRPNSLYNATTTIDDLTLALDNFSRVPSPELPAVLECCCGKEDCANLTRWLESKSRLENRLVLSAGEEGFLSEFARPLMFLRSRAGFVAAP